MNNNIATADVSLCTGPLPSTLSLNIFRDNGIAATVLDKMLGNQARSIGAKMAHEKRKKECVDAEKNISDAKRLTTGILTANSIHSLGHPDFLGVFHERQALRKEKEDKIASVKRAKKKNFLVVLQQ